ncbi:MAG: hypothetical protein C5B50_05745 [Verrucomicrobia bacterium]|nr:MAG: hypothetical protein C5B50_05745 [Verrucomicrobiota bacterium]
MSDIVDIYTNAIYDNLRPMYANWQPGSPIELGDYGFLDRKHFVHQGNVKDLGITFQPRNDTSTDQINFSSKGNTKVTLNAAGSGPVGSGVTVKASLQVDFSSEEAVFFNAAECAYDMIQDKVALGTQIMDRFKKKTWNRDWVVVTDIVNAGATTIAISGSQSSSVVFQASGSVPQINLADASIGLSVVASSNVALQIAAQKGMSPLIGLSKIQHAFLFFGNQFQPKLAMTSFPLPRLATTAEAGDPERNPAYFGQLK